MGLLHTFASVAIFMSEVMKKMLQDLEFPMVREHLTKRCHTELGKEQALLVSPEKDHSYLRILLGQTFEYLASYTNENRIPNHSFDSINGELRLLKIENTTLEISGFRRIGAICNTVVVHKTFFKKFQEYYPLLFEYSEGFEANKEIPRLIDEVIDRFGEIKDSASVQLKQIRIEINQVKGKINQSFASALSSYQASEFLDDIRESVVENRRVLAVKAMYRKKVRGTVMGASKSGSIVYMEPEASLKYSRQLSNLEYDEKEEIQRILNELTAAIRPYMELLD
ncbi:MAG: DNA mismatch repair protein MutS, partial [Bacteroidota bacterium]